MDQAPKGLEAIIERGGKHKEELQQDFRILLLNTKYNWKSDFDNDKPKFMIPIENEMISS